MHAAPREVAVQSFPLPKCGTVSGSWPTARGVVAAHVESWRQTGFNRAGVCQAKRILCSPAFVFLAMTEFIKRHKWAVGLVAVVAVALVVVRARRGRHEVLVAEAFEGTLYLRVATSGLVESESADLAFQAAGEIVGLYADEGDAVSRSDVLARLAPAASAPGSLGIGDVIQAPYDGTVVTVYTRAGSVVAPGQPVLRVVSHGERWVTAFLDSEDAAHVAPGDRFRCRAEGYLSQGWELVVRSVGREAVPRMELPGTARQVRVRCDVVDGPLPLVPGTEVDVDAEVCLVERAVLIPTAAVVHEGVRDWVWLVEGDRAQRREVEVGPNNFDLIQIREGVSVADTVVVEGKRGLSDGMRVRAKPMPPAADVELEDA